MIGLRALQGGYRPPNWSMTDVVIVPGNGIIHQQPNDIDAVQATDEGGTECGERLYPAALTHHRHMRGTPKNCWTFI